jgi:hypothetical protein
MLEKREIGKKLVKRVKCDEARTNRWKALRMVEKKGCGVCDLRFAHFTRFTSFLLIFCFMSAPKQGKQGIYSCLFRL